MLYMLETAAAGAGEAGAANTGALSGLTTLLPLIGIFVVFYFFMLRPQKKQEKETAKMRNELAVGDEVTTIGGIIGKIISVKDETVLIETSGDRTKIRFLKSAIKNVDVKAEDAK